jgi:hypothetical protein
VEIEAGREREGGGVVLPRVNVDSEPPFVSDFAHAVMKADFGEKPYQYFSVMREQNPVAWSPTFNSWSVFRYKDIVRVLL